MASSTYTPGDISSFLQGHVAHAQAAADKASKKRKKHEQAQAPPKAKAKPSAATTTTNALLFSESAQAKFAPVQPLPGLVVRPPGEKRRRKTRKGKERPLRPSKSEKEAARQAAAAAAVAGEGVAAAAGAPAAPMETAPQKKKDKTKASAAAPPVVVGGPVVLAEKDNAVAAPPPAAKKAKKQQEDKGGKTKAAAENDPDQVQEEEGVGRDDEKDRRTVFVGNLPASISKKRVQALFKDYGEIESVRFRSMALAGAKVDDHGNQRLVKKVSANKRLLSDAKDTFNAYVVFVEEAAALRALGANNRLVEEKHLRVDRVGSAATREPKRTIFLGNLPFDAKDDAVRAHVAQGLEGGDADIDGVRLVRDPETQQGKGFGFVLLKDKAAVAAALRLHESTFEGRTIRVTTCGKRPKKHDDQGKPKAMGAKRRLEAAGPKKQKDMKKPNRKKSQSPAKGTSPRHPKRSQAKPSFEGRRVSEGRGTVNLKKRGGGGGGAKKKMGGGGKKGFKK